jgi:hypothetical protein
MHTISATRTQEVPEGDCCVSWNSAVWSVVDGLRQSPPSCTAARDHSWTGVVEGLGHSASTLIRYRCAFFDVDLETEIAYGVKKCSQCLAASK